MADSKSTRSLFQQMDRDRSGTLDFTEFSTEFIRMNPSATVMDMRELFDGADLDHNGLLDYSEFVRMIRASQQPDQSSPGGPSPSELFQQMDRDRSGTLDFAEFSRVFVQFNPSATMDDMRKLFDEADSDRNGSLDHDEFVRMVQASHQPQHPEASSPRGSTEDSKIADDKSSIRKMTDGKSTRSLFQQMDRDRSGTLDFTEFSTEFIRMNPSATVMDMRELFDGADLDHNGLLDYSEFVRMIRASQQPDQSSPGGPSPSELFQQMDRDRSGTLDFAEFSRVFVQFNPSATMDDMRKLFDEADSDRNGSLDHDEFVRMVQASQQPQRRPSKRVAITNDAQVLRQSSAGSDSALGSLAESRLRQSATSTQGESLAQSRLRQSAMSTHAESLAESRLRQSATSTQVESLAESRLRQSATSKQVVCTSKSKRQESISPGASELTDRPTEITAVLTRSDDDDSIDGRQSSSRRKSKRGFTITPRLTCFLCVCYFITLGAAVFLGFFLYWALHAVEGSGITLPFLGDVGQGNPGGGTVRNDSGGGGVAGLPTVGDAPIVEEAAVVGGPSAETTDGLYAVSYAPSAMPSTLYPTTAPSAFPSASPTASTAPTVSSSATPSLAPTGTPGCPDTLTRSVMLDEGNGLELRFEVVEYTGEKNRERGGLFCAQLLYTGEAAWLGLALSEATRNPQFGRKEAIIGMPNVDSVAAVSDGKGGAAAVGHQVAGAPDDGPAFVNPGKYDIPAGGVDGYSGPALGQLVPPERQTLVDARCTYVDTNIQGMPRYTVLEFTKYLAEPRTFGEIEIDPYDLTLILYAVAPLDDGGGGFDGNPDWEVSYTRLLEGPQQRRSGEYIRRRRRKDDGEAFHN